MTTLSRLAPGRTRSRPQAAADLIPPLPLPDSVPNPLIRTFRAYAADARAAFRSAPVEVALGVALAVALSVEVRSKAFTEGEFVRMAASAALAFPLVFALSVLAARGAIGSAARWGGTAAVLAACAAYGWLGLHDDREADGWRWALLASAAVLLLAMTPGLPWRDRDRRRSWAFGWRLALRVVGIGLYSAALFAVLAGAVAAVVSLFELRQPDHVYTDLAGAVFFAFAPWIFVGGIHRLSVPPPDGVPEGVSRLGRWLYAPVLVIYLAVLYAYAVKVLVTGELPRNLVSPLVITAGLIGLLGAVLLEPVHGDDEHRGVSMLARAVPALLLPLVPLALWALGARLDEYGWTEFRYVRVAIVVAIGILAVLGTIRLVRRGRPMQGTVPAVFAAVALLSAIGPWSAPAHSRRDQTARLRAEFRRARIDPLRLPADTVTVDSAAYERMVSGARYLASAHGIGALRAVVPALPDSTRGVWEMGTKLGIRPGCRPGGAATSELTWGPGVRVPAGTMVPLDVDEARPGAAVAGSTRATIANDRLRLQGGGWSAEGDLVPLRRMLEGRPGACLPAWERGAAGRHAPAEAMVEIRDAAGGVRAQVIVTYYRVSAPETRAAGPQQPGVHVRELRGFLVVR
jgi:cytochrome bd-type quinol oxidase subunit 2